MSEASQAQKDSAPPAASRATQKSGKLAQFTDPRVARRVLYVLALLSLIAPSVSYRLPTLGTLFGQLSLRSYDFLATADERLQRWLETERPAPPDVVVVGVDEESLKRYGRWPWNRSVMADLVLGLKHFGVRTTAMDVLFAEPQWSPLSGLGEVLEGIPEELRDEPFVRDLMRLPALERNLRGVPEQFQDHPSLQQLRRRLVPPWEDEILAQALQQAGNVVLGLVIQRLDETQGEMSWVSDDKPPRPPENARRFLARRVPDLGGEDLEEAWATNVFVGLFFDEGRPFPLVELPGGPGSRVHFRSTRPFASGLALPLPSLLEGAVGAGYMNDQVTADAVVRTMPLAVLFEGYCIPSLTLAAISHYLEGYPELEVDSSNRVLGFRILRGEGPDAREVARFQAGQDMEAWIHFYGSRDVPATPGAEELGSYRSRIEEPVLSVVPAHEVLDAYQGLRGVSEFIEKADLQKKAELEKKAETLRARLEGRIAFVGATAFGLTDIRSTPIGEFRPGVEAHASMAANLLDRTAFRMGSHEFLVGMGSSLVFLLVLAFVLPRVRPFQALIFFGVESLVAIGWCWVLLRNSILLAPWDVLFPLFFLLASGLAFLNLVENREKAWIDGMFKRYVSADYVEMIKANKGALDLNGHEAVITPFFSDMAGFSTISEAFTAAGLFRFLGEYLGEMGDILDEYGGTLDKFEGDAVVAFFGAPIHYDDHALKACLASLRMQERIRELEKEWQQSDRYPELHRLAEKRGEWFPIVVRIGLNTGSCATGHLGTAERGNYTMMGDTVNLAARLESAGKQYGITLTISDETREAAGEAIVTRPVDVIQVVGRTVGTKIFQVMGQEGQIPGETLRFLVIYRDAWDFYLDRQFEKARERYQRALELLPRDRVCQIFLERCEHFLAHPPPEDWDGVHVLTAK